MELVHVGILTSRGFCNAPIPGYVDVTATCICRSKIPPHIYAKHRYDKNQSTKVCGALYIPTYEYNYKVITGYDTILQEYCITDGRKCENTKRFTYMNSTKDSPELQKENSGDEQEGLEG